MNLDKEWEKLEDLEFEYNIARLARLDEDVIKLAKAKYMKQVNKVRKLQEMNSNEKKDKNSINTKQD